MSFTAQNPDRVFFLYRLTVYHDDALHAVRQQCGRQGLCRHADRIIDKCRLSVFGGQEANGCRQYAVFKLDIAARLLLHDVRQSGFPVQQGAVGLGIGKRFRRHGNVQIGNTECAAAFPCFRSVFQRKRQIVGSGDNFVGIDKLPDVIAREGTCFLFERFLNTAAYILQHGRIGAFQRPRRLFLTARRKQQGKRQQGKFAVHGFPLQYP